MKRKINIYCDESCHLENDHIQSMSLGAIWCNESDTASISNNIKAIKKKHHMSSSFEIKWTKVSPAKKDFYLELIEYFFSESKLHFRCIIIPDKSKLDHDKFHQSHDDWYYKMYFLLIKGILNPEHNFNVYIDIKDTKGAEKVKKLHEVLCNSTYDFDKNIIKNIQQIRSHEASILQITDLFIGAITYRQRNLKTSQAKLEIIERIKKLSNHNLCRSTLPREDKFNIFVWNPNNAG
jgi:hypothetical protein